MTPSQKRFEADHTLGHEIDQRLVEQLELFPRQPSTHIQLELSTKLEARIHLSLEEAERATLLGFGPIERDVGVFEQCRSGVPVIGHERQPDGHADLDLMAVDIERFLHRRDDTLRQQLDVLGPGDMSLDDRELVAAKPRHRVALAHAGQQPP